MMVRGIRMTTDALVHVLIKWLFSAKFQPDDTSVCCEIAIMA